MITFLPYPNYIETAECLDWQYPKNRLRNQIIEAMLIARALIADENHIYHPVYDMWESFEWSLLDYATTCLFVWERKTKTVNSKQRSILVRLQNVVVTSDIKNFTREKPSWIGDERIHSSHRAVLLGKSSWYNQFCWVEKPAKRGSDAKWPYVWPESKND